MEKYLTVLEYLETEIDLDWVDVEREGENSRRFDFGNMGLSLWVNHDMGEVSAEGAFPLGIKKVLWDLGVITF